MSINLRQDLQISFYKERYAIDKKDQFYTASTTRDITF